MRLFLSFLILSFSHAFSLGSTKISLMRECAKTIENQNKQIIMQNVEELEKTSTTTMNEDNLYLLDGVWKTIYTTLPSAQGLTSLDKLSYNNLPFPKHELNELTVEALNIYQLVNLKEQSYDNIIDLQVKTSFIGDDNNNMQAFLLTKGHFSLHADQIKHKNRLDISFKSMELVPVTYNDYILEVIDSDYR